MPDLKHVPTLVERLNAVAEQLEKWADRLDAENPPTQLERKRRQRLGMSVVKGGRDDG